MLILIQDPNIHQALGRCHTVIIFGDPKQRLQVAQAAFALFDIRLDHIALAALFDVPRLTLGQFGGDEFFFCAAKDLLGEGGPQRFGHVWVAADRALF